MSDFRTELGETIFKQKYANYPEQSWQAKVLCVLYDVFPRYVSDEPAVFTQAYDALYVAMKNFQFIPAGRYLYYAGRDRNFFNNCFIFRSQEDSREAWAELAHDVTSSLMSGGGVGNDYSIFRPNGSRLEGTGGTASGAVSLMKIANEIGREVMQGGSRRSALYASLNWQHGDIDEFMSVKNWDEQFLPDGMSFKEAKEKDFNFPAPLDMTNISVNYDDAWLALGEEKYKNATFLRNVKQSMKNGEPSFSFNFGDKQNETGRNACTEVTSSDDGDVCNLGSINLANIDDLESFREIVRYGTLFLLLGTISGELPHEKITRIRDKNRRLGLGLMGVHEWLLKRGYRYEVVPELHEWLKVYEEESDKAADEFSELLGVNRPVAVRAIAPTGTIGMLAGTTTGIEPIYAVAYKRRFLVGGADWKYQYCIDATAKAILESNPELNPDDIETALTLSEDIERRIKFQADVQDYVDMAISSTGNLPAWGSPLNNESRVEEFAEILAKYAERLRGITFYADGSRGGQPIVPVRYSEADGKEGVTFEENDPCNGGVCGI